MEIKSRKGKINQPVILFSGLVILILALLTYFLIMRNIFGNFSASGILPDFDKFSEFFSGKKAPVAVLYSRYTENMLPEGSTWLNDNIGTWKKFLAESKTSYEIINDEVIESGNHYDYKIIILPGSKSLSDREIVNLKKFIDKGGSIFATSGTASYASDGKWRGWEFFSEVFGVRFSREISGNELSKVHTIRGGLPLTANIPTGYLLKIASWDRPIAVEVLDPRTIQASFWYNYRLQAGLVREGIKKTAGIVYGTYGSGRFVWMGFEPNSVLGEQEDYVYFDRLFRNCIGWLSYSPLGFIREWPDGYEAAAVIAPSFKKDMNNVGNILDLLSSEKISATFFVDENTGTANKNTLKALSGYGEVAPIIDIGHLNSVNDTINKLDNVALQTEKLQKAKNTFEYITKKTVNGFLPYHGLYDLNTEAALINSGYNYVLTDSLTDRSVPKTLFYEKKKISSVTKTARDDYEVIRDFGLTQPEYQFYTYQEDIDRILFEGGMYIMKLHNDYQLLADNTGVVKEIIKDLKRKKFWITTADEICRWSNDRNLVNVRVEKRGNSRVVVRISNSGNSDVDMSIVQVDLSEKVRDLTCNSEIIGTVPAVFDFDRNTNTVYLHIKNLKPGESRIYFLDYSIRNV